MYKRMPKILRHDSRMLRVGVTFKRIRKDRDMWEMIDEPAEAHDYMAYMDIRPKHRGIA